MFEFAVYMVHVPSRILPHWLCQLNARLIQLMHTFAFPQLPMTWGSNGGQWEDKKCSNFITKVTLFYRSAGSQWWSRT